MGHARPLCYISGTTSSLLAREMAHVLDINVGVALSLGYGTYALAFIQEDRRAVAIVNYKTHNEFIMQRLAVKGNSLAPDTRPAKPD